MSPKKIKKKSNNFSNKPNQSTPNPHSWPNLPLQLINLIARQPNLMLNITAFGGVTKTWRSTPNHSSNLRLPQLTEIGSESNHKIHTFGIDFKEAYPHPYWRRRSRPIPRDIYFKGHSHGHLIVSGNNFSDLYLWKRLVEPCGVSTSCGLPPWNLNLPFKLATLSCERDDPMGCDVMVLTGDSSPAFAFYRKSSTPREWIVQDCNLKDPFGNHNQNMEFRNAIGFRKKFYALSLQGSLVVIENVGSGFEITGVGKNRGVPSKNSRQYREFLFDFNGDILLVFMISRKSIDVVDDVEVFRLDFEKLVWLKVESLGDGALFLEDECCMGVKAGEVGCRKNCIYFTHSGGDLWFAYDMEIGQIFPISDNGTTSEYMKWDEQEVSKPPRGRYQRYQRLGLLY